MQPVPYVAPCNRLPPSSSPPSLWLSQDRRTRFWRSLAPSLASPVRYGLWQRGRRLRHRGGSVGDRGSAIDRGRTNARQGVAVGRGDGPGACRAQPLALSRARARRDCACRTLRPCAADDAAQSESASAGSGGDAGRRDRTGGRGDCCAAADHCGLVGRLDRDRAAVRWQMPQLAAAGWIERVGALVLAAFAAVVTGSALGWAG